MRCSKPFRKSLMYYPPLTFLKSALLATEKLTGHRTFR